MQRYGWRAYTLPVLTAATVAVLFTGGAAAARHPGPTRSVAAVAPARPSPVTVRRAVETTVCVKNTYHQLVVVSIDAQHAWMCERHRQVYSTAVTTGASFNGYGTPLGSWRVQSRERDRDLVGPGYRDHVKYWVPFNGDFGFHDASWQTMAFGSPDYETDGSHGCVHLPMPAMVWLYGWAQVDSTVVTVVE